MSFENLSKVIENDYLRFLDFASKLVFKDQIEADAETPKQASQSEVMYMEANLARDSSLIEAYHENSIRLQNLIDRYGDLNIALGAGEDIPAFAESNKYYRELYVNHGVSPYTARTSDDFELLWYPDGYLTPQEVHIFKNQFNINLVYFMKVLYTEAYKNDTGYRSFIRFYLAFTSIERSLDILKGAPSMNIELMDEYAIRNMLYSYGVYFLDDLNKNYQKRVIRNLNYLLRNKGTDRIFVNIFEIFGFENVEAFRYYLVRDYDRDADGRPIFTQPEPKFLRVPFLENNYETFLDNLQDSEKQTLLRDYDSIISDDHTWKATKEEVKQMQFNIINTKYFDLDSILDIMKASTNTAYFFNYLFDIRENRELDERLSFSIGKMSTQPIRCLDALLAVNHLMLVKFGYKGNIPLHPQELKHVYSIRKNIDASRLSNLFKETFNISTLDHIIDKTGEIDSDSFETSIDQFLEIRDRLKRAIEVEENAKKYYALLGDYEYLFVSDVMMSKFSDFETYLDYIKENNIEFGQYLEVIQESNEGVINETISQILESIDSFIESKFFDPYFAGVSGVLNHIIKLINAFKAFTIDLRKVNIIPLIDDSFNKIKILEQLIEFSEFHNSPDTLTFDDYLGFVFSVGVDEYLGISDMIRLFGEIFLSSDLELDDLVGKILSIISKSDILVLTDLFKNKGSICKILKLCLDDKFTLTSGNTYEGVLDLLDRASSFSSSLHQTVKVYRDSQTSSARISNADKAAMLELINYISRIDAGDELLAEDKQINLGNIDLLSFINFLVKINAVSDILKNECFNICDVSFFTSKSESRENISIRNVIRDISSEILNNDKIVDELVVTRSTVNFNESIIKEEINRLIKLKFDINLNIGEYETFLSLMTHSLLLSLNDNLLNQVAQKHSEYTCIADKNYSSANHTLAIQIIEDDVIHLLRSSTEFRDKVIEELATNSSAVNFNESIIKEEIDRLIRLRLDTDLGVRGYEELLSSVSRSLLLHLDDDLRTRVNQKSDECARIEDVGYISTGHIFAIQTIVDDIIDLINSAIKLQDKIIGEIISTESTIGFSESVIKEEIDRLISLKFDTGLDIGAYKALMSSITHSLLLPVNDSLHNQAIQKHGECSSIEDTTYTSASHTLAIQMLSDDIIELVHSSIEFQDKIIDDTVYGFTNISLASYVYFDNFKYKTEPTLRESLLSLDELGLTLFLQRSNIIDYQDDIINLSRLSECISLCIKDSLKISARVDFGESILNENQEYVSFLNEKDTIIGTKILIDTLVEIRELKLLKDSNSLKVIDKLHNHLSFLDQSNVLSRIDKGELANILVDSKRDSLVKMSECTCIEDVFAVLKSIVSKDKIAMRDSFELELIEN